MYCFSEIAMVIVGLQIIFRVFPWLYKNFIGPALNESSVEMNTMGKWALVTGATDGIGKEYARTLARQGMNVVLVSRSLSKLQNVAKEIVLESETRVQIKIIDVDFTGGSEIYDKIGKAIAGLEIGVLVNNVGMVYPQSEYFLLMKDRDQWVRDILACNVLSVTEMCGLVMPSMVERGKGVVINLSSVSALMPFPMMSIYAATKSFVNKFTHDLHAEYSSSGIIFQSVCAGPVATNMSISKKATWMHTSASNFVDSAMKRVGLSIQTTGYYPHTLLLLVIDFMQFFSPAFVNKFILDRMEGNKKKTLQKELSKTK